MAGTAWQLAVTVSVMATVPLCDGLWVSRPHSNTIQTKLKHNTNNTQQCTNRVGYDLARSFIFLNLNVFACRLPPVACSGPALAAALADKK